MEVRGWQARLGKAGSSAHLLDNWVIFFIGHTRESRTVLRFFLQGRRAARSVLDVEIPELLWKLQCRLDQGCG